MEVLGGSDPSTKVHFLYFFSTRITPSVREGRAPSQSKNQLLQKSGLVQTEPDSIGSWLSKVRRWKSNIVVLPRESGVCKPYCVERNVEFLLKMRTMFGALFDRHGIYHNLVLSKEELLFIIPRCKCWVATIGLQKSYTLFAILNLLP